MQLNNFLTLLGYTILFVAPMVYQRLHYKLAPQFFYKLGLRKRTGLQIHHAHWGLGWIFISMILMILQTLSIIHIASFWFLLPATLGWGLFFDEIIPHLRMPGDDRALELKVYEEAGPATIKLIAIIAALILIIGIILNNYL